MLQWDSLEAHTAAPYTLSLKSNGCIIFIAALNSSKLLVTSKHSLGSLPNTARSHSQVGEEWLQKHLEKAGKTTEQLAAVLCEKKWTAVAEVRSTSACVRPLAKRLLASCATMASKNTSSHTLPKDGDSTSTASMRTRNIFAHSPPTLLTSSQTNGDSSRPRPSCSTPSKR